MNIEKVKFFAEEKGLEIFKKDSKSVTLKMKGAEWYCKLSTEDLTEDTEGFIEDVAKTMKEQEAKRLKALNDGR